jgi:hypothetical protein
VATRTEVAAISPAGRVAGRTISVLLFLTGAAIMVAAWPGVWIICPSGAEPCIHRAAAAGLTTIVGIIVIGLGVAIWFNVRRRPVTGGGPSGYRWGLGALFAGGLVLASKQIPPWTCAVGRFDELLHACVTLHARAEPADWLPLKSGLIAFGLLGGMAIGVLRKWIGLSAFVSAIAWLGGIAWLLNEAFVRS